MILKFTSLTSCASSSSSADFNNRPSDRWGPRVAFRSARADSSGSGGLRSSGDCGRPQSARDVAKVEAEGQAQHRRRITSFCSQTLHPWASKCNNSPPSFLHRSQNLHRFETGGERPMENASLHTRAHVEKACAHRCCATSPACNLCTAAPMGASLYVKLHLASLPAPS